MGRGDLVSIFLSGCFLFGEEVWVVNLVLDFKRLKIFGLKRGSEIGLWVLLGKI